MKLLIILCYTLSQHVIVILVKWYSSPPIKGHLHQRPLILCGHDTYSTFLLYLFTPHQGAE